MPRFHVLLFAIARDLAAADSVVVDVALPTTAAELSTAIGVAQPALVPWLPSCRLAVNQEFVRSDQVIHEVTEVALIPPVSGG